MKKDFIQEMQYGEGAIKVPAKFMLINRGDDGCVILGGLFENLLQYRNEKDPDNPHANLDDGVEMWVGEVILIPRWKFRRNQEENFVGLTCNQMICSNWGNPGSWKEKLFEKKE